MVPTCSIAGAFNCQEEVEGFNGEGVAQDETEALKCYRLCSRRRSANAAAQINL